MKVARFTVNLFGENTYILWDEESREAVIVDPGMSNDREREIVDDYIVKNHLKLRQMLFTHLHLDHTFGVEYISENYGVDTACSIQEKPLGESTPEQAKLFHLRADVKHVTITKELHDGDVIYVGNEAIHVILISGHSPGGLVYYCPESAFVLTGDVLFKNAIGRTDLLDGDYESLVSGIKEKLFTLPDDTLVCPGHGETTTIGAEKISNPYLV